MTLSQLVYLTINPLAIDMGGGDNTFRKKGGCGRGTYISFRGGKNRGFMAEGIIEGLCLVNI